MLTNQRPLYLFLVVCLVFGSLGGSAQAVSASGAATPPSQGISPGGASFTPAPGTLSTLPKVKFDSSQPPNLDQGLQKMSEVEPQLVCARDSKLDAGQFDLAALDAGLDYDPVKISDFVRTQIASSSIPVRCAATSARSSAGPATCSTRRCCCAACWTMRVMRPGWCAA